MTMMFLKQHMAKRSIQLEVCLYSVLPSRKSDQEILKIRLLSDYISTKNQTKRGPKLAILRLKSDLFKNLNFGIEQINF